MIKYLLIIFLALFFSFGNSFALDSSILSDTQINNPTLKSLSPEQVNEYINSQDSYFQSMNNVVEKEHLNDWDINSDTKNTPSTFNPDQYDDFDYASQTENQINNSILNDTGFTQLNSLANPKPENFNYDKFKEINNTLERTTSDLQAMTQQDFQSPQK